MDTGKAAELLDEKLQLFARYSKVTALLLEQSTDTGIEKYITEREVLANKIDRVDCQINEELAPWGETARALMSGKAVASDLPDELRPLQDACERIMGTVRRIRMLNSEALELCEQLKNENERMIKKTSNIPKINRYLSNLSGPRGGNNFGSV